MIKHNRPETKEESLSLPTGTPEGFVLTPESGLTDDEALRAAERGEANKASEDPGKTVGRIVADNLFTLFNLLNVLLAVALAIVGAYRNMLFLGVVVSNTLIGTIQELRARKTVNKLKLLSEAPIKVKRNSAVRELPAADAVKGDIVLLKAGDQVPADAIMRTGVCSASEALLTGEQDAIEKKQGDWLYSGSFLTSGGCECQLVHVGDESYINRLGHSAKKIIPPKSALMTDLRRIVRLVSVLLVPIGIALFCKQFFMLKAPLNEAIPSSVAAMIGMIPEGLILLASVALAVGVIKLGRRNTLVQELYGIETLARIDTLCLDKTGTLTTGAMSLAELVPYDAAEEELRATLSRFLGAVDNTAPTLAAVARCVPPEAEEPDALLPFSSDRKNTAVTLKDGKTVVVGAPSFTLGSLYEGAVKDLVESKASKGLRVLAAAECEGRIEDGVIPPVKRILGFCVIADELRKEAPECLEYFREQGVTLKIISGDDPVTVSHIAESAGLAGATGSAVDASLIPENELAEAAEKYTVFGRVTPERKQKLIAALKAKGHNAAMTGDGVNDIPAMKTADCSIAMAGGADAARHTAQLILLDNNFTSLPQVVAEGRRVINNISRTASLFLVKTIYSFLLSLLMLLLPAVYPFQPIQLTLVSALTIGAPSFFLALEPNSERVRGNFLKTVLLRALPGGLAVTIAAAVSSMLGAFWPKEVCSTVATLAAGITGLLMLLNVCLPFTKLRAIVFGTMCVLFTAASIILGKVFYLVPLGGAQIAALAAMALFSAAVIFGTRFLVEKFRKTSARNR